MAPSTIGALARRHNVSVRTLHHYDAIGLLPPSERSQAGYRLYSSDDEARLEQILLLRGLGLSLDDIQRCLQDAAPILTQLIDARIQRVQQHLQALREQHRSLQAVRLQLRPGQAASLEQLLRLKETIAMIEDYYTREQLEQLDQRARTLGPEGMLQAQRDWQDVYDDARRCLEQDLPPDGPEGRAIGQRANALIAAFTGGDPGIEGSLQRLYDERGDEPLQQQGWSIEPELQTFVQQAIQAAREA